jgi:hypothetical protein
MTFIPIKIESFTADNYLYEVGSTANPLLNWKLDKQPTSVEINGIPQTVAMEGSATFSITEDTKFELIVTDKTNTKADLDIKFVYYVYCGKAGLLDAYDSAFVKSLKSQLQETKDSKFTVTANADEYIYYAAPAAYGTPVFTVGGFDGGFEFCGEVEVSTDNNTTMYNLYKSTNPNLGETTVVVS